MRSSRLTTTAAVSVVGALGAGLMLVGCSGSDSNDAALSGDTGGQPGRTSAGGEVLADPAPGTADGLTAEDQLAQGQGAQPATPGSLAGVSVERSVIAVAEMTLRTEDVVDAVDQVGTVALSLGGYVAGQDVSTDPDRPARSRATIVVRVPTDKLATAMDRVRDAGDVERVTSDQQDVTEQVVDVESRVKSARASVDRIRALLSEATTIGEVVRIESELSRREADLEALLAQQRALADQTAMATLTVSVLAPAAVEPPAEDTSGFVPGLTRGWEALVDVVVVLLTVIGVLLPFLVVGALVLGPLAAAWQHRRRTRRPVVPPPAEREPERVS